MTTVNSRAQLDSGNKTAAKEEKEKEVKQYKQVRPIPFDWRRIYREKNMELT